MLSTTAFAEIATLVGDPARANMLNALMDGRALTAKELAQTAGVTPQTASGHLGRLVDARLLVVTRQGRHHYHRLASPAVAQMLEGIMAVAIGLREPPARPPVTGPRDRAMRLARTCYDHLAGRLAVALADAMVERGQVELHADGGALTDAGRGFLLRLGADLPTSPCAAAGRTRRIFCRPCLDWSERRPHIGGAVGAALCRLSLERAWVRRVEGSRSLLVTRAGEAAFKSEFGVAVQP
jgi:DNA-binding transcriptional ArsR family regulator